MIWLAAIFLALLVLAPSAWALRRAQPGRGAREAALELYRAQLREVERDHAEGRLADAEFAGAQLEIQRRMLAADARAENDRPPEGRRGLVVILPLLVLAGGSLYLVNGQPDMPAQPLLERREAAAREDALISELRAGLRGLPADAPMRREGLLLLGNAEAQRGNMEAAAAAWREALATGFDPTLAAMTGAAILQAEGKVTEEARALFRRALAEGAPDAAWRPMAERMLARE